MTIYVYIYMYHTYIYVYIWQEGEEPERREDASGGDSVWDSSHPAHEGAVRSAPLQSYMKRELIIFGGGKKVHYTTCS